MPWKAFKRDDGWCVFKLDVEGEPTGDTLGCHESQEKAKQQIAALYANEPKSYAVKAVGETETHHLIGGYGVIWGGKDLVGEHFTKATDFWFDKLTRTHAVMYHHGKDQAIKKVDVGRVNALKPDDVGLWVESQLDKAKQYVDGIMALIEKGALGLSSGAVSHLVEKKDDGEIKTWPIAEFSLTPTPCEPRTLGVQALRSIAELEPAVKAYLPQDGGEPSADATKADVTDMNDNTGATDMTEQLEETQAPVVSTTEPAVKAMGIDPGMVKQIADEVMSQFRSMPNINFGAAKAGPDLEAKSEMDELKAYTEYLAYGKDASPEALKVVYQIGSETGGGYLQAPQQFVNQLIQKVDDQVFIRGFARKFSLPQAESMGAPSLDTDASDSDWTSELAVGSEESTLAFGKRELRPQPLAKYVKVSNVLLRKAPASENIVMERLAYKIGVTQEKAYLSGSGAGQPLGVFTASADGINTTADQTAAASDDIGADDIIDMKYALKPQYWPRARWIMHRDVAKLVAKIKDGESRPLWDNGGMNSPNGITPTLNGFPVHMSEFAPNTISTGKYVAILGDFSFYWIVDALAMTVQRLVELYAATNQTGFIVRAEMDGAPVLEEPFVRLKLA
jgi:HK97 family phage major capsid protein